MIRSARLHATLWTLVLMIGFSIPGRTLNQFSLLSPDKLLHFVSFLIMTVLWLRVYTKPKVRVVVGIALFGVFVEVYQHVMPINRSFDIGDILADFAGLAVGTMISLAVARFGKSQEAQQL